MYGWEATRLTLSNLAVGLFALVTASACSDSPQRMSGPSEPSTSIPTVSEPAVLVNAVSIVGTVRQGTDDAVQFQIRVTAPGGLNTIRQVVMEYSQPGPNHHGGSMMGGYRGTVSCYDDGTHGDDIPGDGIYHCMDPQNQIGCHGVNAPHGEYHYNFWCWDVYGQRSNTASLTIVRE